MWMNRHDSVSDEALIEEIRRGDRDAAACLYHRHINRVHRICHRIVSDRSEVADCVQEVWLKVFRSLGRFRREESFVAWLNSIAVNTSTDYWRRRKRHRDRVAIEDAQPESLPSNDPIGGQRLDDMLVHRRIQQVLEQVSVKQRTALILRYLEGMPLPEIARVLGCREGTVRTHIHRCLLFLRAKLAGKRKQ